MRPRKPSASPVQAQCKHSEAVVFVKTVLAEPVIPRVELGRLNNLNCISPHTQTQTQPDHPDRLDVARDVGIETAQSERTRLLVENTGLLLESSPGQPSHVRPVRTRSSSTEEIISGPCRGIKPFALRWA